ncbi:Mitochondrial carnitine/acylcarnitine carrier-like protein [Galdieria sulphuraria]|uniref:Mitochondrial carrier (BOU / S-adenosylmethionine carrier) n=1 Tax=Galdieria sulphuraria TaxID=130081 RepID=M2XKC7_GALSU|nr:mitochondrial carrier (BOU / S-adenosylmethionine carrier) [Galdieria sulphuraria]EME30592.1 mitochondrial carrier (BOU / S-adenosylmethionine carrier) [Galdieria sulphuraria]GJD08989.1 Mitochondrial carnitine/acylcarnitine carrier-like protein [Galdieria sulphuraria]|eukprot:XP_005707112.1 mitochondrial carrier (BOU / S-adenosylmethionine carrier) [Galdieria sulphuraria]
MNSEVITEQTFEEKETAKTAVIAKDLLAGTAGGTAQLLVGHPFDTIKVKLQNQPWVPPGQTPQYTGAIDAVKKTVGKEGLGGLYKGMGAPLAFVAVFNAVLFASNGQMKRIVHGEDDKSLMTIPEFALCGAGAGLAVSFVACPTELIKCRLQAQSADSATVYKGPVDCARQVWKSRGTLGLFKGLGATLGREVPANAIYFSVYEYTKGLFVPQGGSKEDLGSGALLLAGGIAGLMFWGTVYPIDVVKTRIQTDSDTLPKFRGIVDATRKIVQQEGLRGLYKGFLPCLARAFPANAVTFLTYEAVAHFLERQFGLR